mgnify:CR=1 FL=1
MGQKCYYPNDADSLKQKNNPACKIVAEIHKPVFDAGGDLQHRAFAATVGAERQRQTLVYLQREIIEDIETLEVAETDVVKIDQWLLHDRLSPAAR